MNLAQRILIGIVKAYRLTLSPWIGSACRFTPTCSMYALQALQEHGAAAGAYLAAARIARCHPWCAGGHDPVPQKNNAPTLRCPPGGPTAPKGGLSARWPRIFAFLHQKKLP